MGNKVLVVDDDPEILELLALTLTSSGYEAALARNAEEFRQKAWLLTPDLIILDIMLGEDNGPEIYDKLLAQGFNPDIPIIFLSALASDRPDVAPQQGRRYALIGKPFDPDKLVEEISGLIRAA